MNQNQSCSRCGTPQSSDVAGSVCVRCSSATSEKNSHDSSATTSNVANAVQPKLPSTFLDDVVGTIGKSFQLVNERPYILLAFGFGFYRKWKNNEKFTWGIVGWSVAILIGIVVLYAVIRAAFPRVMAFMKAEPRPQPPPAQTTSSTTSHGWWLLHGGRPTGPHSLLHLMDAADRGDFSPDALVCPVGAQQWAALETILPPRIPANAESVDPPAAT